MHRADCDSITQSICRCWLATNRIGYSDNFQPALRVEVDDALRWVSDLTSAGEPSGEYRSLQLSYLRSQWLVQDHPEHALITVHYLFLITAAFLQNHAISEVTRDLPKLLRKDSDLDKFFGPYTGSLQSIYLHCRRLWEQHAGLFQESPN